MVRLRYLTVSSLLTLAIGATAHAIAAQAPKPAASTQGAKPAATADARDVNLRAYVELLRSDVRSQKVAILSEMMAFTEQEDAKFWPIYREYDVELSKINDDRVTLIQEYAKNYDQMTDAVADRIARGALDLEVRRNALKQKYYDRLKAALSAKTAARFLQVENQLLMIVDLQIAAALPVVK
jgi:predicted RNA-binding protein with RPS1 domain